MIASGDAGGFAGASCGCCFWDRVTGDLVIWSAAWSALATGHWSLVDLFETHGRCVVVARPNMADAADPRALTLRERDVAERAALGRSGKEIAYELGLRTPTVSQLLHNAVRKLGAAGVAQLGTVVRGLGQLGFDRGRSS